MSHFIPQDLYNQFLHHMPLACVDLALVSNGCILLVKRKDAPAKGQWWVPGGRVIKGETMRETARRKAIQELGIVCHVGPLVHTAETIFPDGPFGISVHSTNSCFLLYPASDISRTGVTLDEHHQEWQWVRTIPDSLHSYVVDCLRGAGLE